MLRQQERNEKILEKENSFQDNQKRQLEKLESIEE
jgi:hypothetical protein